MYSTLKGWDYSVHE